MPPTRIADVVVPEVFNPYVSERTAELSALQAAGIISNNPELDALAAGGGTIINMPFWEDLTGEDETLSDDTALGVDKITASKDAAGLLMRGKAWSANDLAKALSGSDPMGEIGDKVAAFWARRRQKTLLSILAGVFANASMEDKIHDISAEIGAAATYTAKSFIDAAFLMGDAEDRLTAIAMHSTVYASLKKQDVIEVERPSQSAAFATYDGKRVIVDDGMPVSGTGADRVFTSYVFGEGAIGLGNGAAPVPTETDRDTLSGDDILVNRQHFILHPRGVRFLGTNVAGDAPTNAELANSANWNRVYEEKNVRIVAFKHKVAA